jgi:DNA-binding protein YbaB
MPDELSKSQKKALRDLIYRAHNEALRRALPEFSADFDDGAVAKSIRLL